MLTNPQLDSIREYIQLELLRRGFTAKIIEFGEDIYGINFKTEDFQTTPVLFKRLFIKSSDTNISDKKTLGGVSYNDVYINVMIRHEYFDLGQNGIDLFHFKCKVNSTYVFEMKTYN